MVTVKERKKEDTGILYVRGMEAKNISWIKSEALRLNRSMSDYINKLVTELRKHKVRPVNAAPVNTVAKSRKVTKRKKATTKKK